VAEVSFEQALEDGSGRTFNGRASCSTSAKQKYGRTHAVILYSISAMGLCPPFVHARVPTHVQSCSHQVPLSDGTVTTNALRAMKRYTLLDAHGTDDRRVLKVTFDLPFHIGITNLPCRIRFAPVCRPELATS